MPPLNKANYKRHWPAQQRGAVAVLLTVAMVALLAIAGLALDGGHLMLNKARLQNAVDAAALSGAKTLSLTYGAVGAGDVARSAALNTLSLNAKASDGNGELAVAIAKAGGLGKLAKVEFSSGIYDTFTEAFSNNDRYVRVTVENHWLEGFFWKLLASLGGGDLGDKRVSARAVAGPSPAAACDITPLMVCGDVNQKPTEENFWGHEFGDLQVLKNTSWTGSGVGPGNYQLLDLVGSGADGVRNGLAGGVNHCYRKGDEVLVKTGNNAGPVSQGFNTRFGDYNGPFSESDRSAFPPDLVTSYTAKGNKGLELSGDAKNGGEYISFDGSKVVWSVRDGDNGKVAVITNEKGDRIDGYSEWMDRAGSCAVSPASCEPGGEEGRRIIKIVVADCSVGINGKKEITVLGVGCFFALQPMSSTGSDEIYGQFVEECSSDGYSGMDPSEDFGPQIIQLYKTYLDGVGSPSNDS